MCVGDEKVELAGPEAVDLLLQLPEPGGNDSVDTLPADLLGFHQSNVCRHLRDLRHGDESD